eukprot:CAMPEP_0114335382 /NCGR_PEP_ID=MMETSP0101-20121206/5019_1 /TAXON_ID=38822 ORGANISM="Pteridomonas danica, Strain PT" /NCGR_SAMPLE_ID=MMETSP0101 /ASSEMBLY_ACC=CAM_ASM_000211 /LENGTH=106 /DNA_ID=CAMNT_0001466985 /DNA_START=458 /DNA_END=778 /DNA_ORIENTATION=+
MAYAIFLSVIDSGSSASGWITSSIVRHLKISYSDWSKLPTLIWIATICQFSALIIVPFLSDVQDVKARTTTNDDEEVDGIDRDDNVVKVDDDDAFNYDKLVDQFAR